MTKKIDNGGPAFPCEQSETQGGTWNQTFEPGMTLRDWFAGQALIAIATSEHSIVSETSFDEKLDIETIYARFAYQTADAMLKAREE